MHRITEEDDHEMRKCLLAKLKKYRPLRLYCWAILAFAALLTNCYKLPLLTASRPTKVVSKSSSFDLRAGGACLSSSWHSEGCCEKFVRMLIFCCFVVAIHCDCEPVIFLSVFYVALLFTKFPKTNSKKISLGNF